MDDNIIANLATESFVLGSTPSNDNFPHWDFHVKKVLLVQPSCSSTERGFSLFGTLSSQQESALGDCSEATEETPTELKLLGLLFHRIRAGLLLFDFSKKKL